MLAPDAPVVWFDTIDSTNEEATRRARAGDLGPVWLEAGVQTAGRGRRGRAWLSQPGNVFMTYFGATTRPPAEVALLGFATAVAVGETVDALAGRAAAQLKWPNDVLLGGAKVCGILLESGPTSQGAVWFALGVGVNVVSAPEGLDYPIASLAGLGVREDAASVRARLRAAIGDAARTLAAEGFAPIRARWTGMAIGMGKTVRAQSGAEPIEGRAIGLDADGALRVETPDGQIRSISAGEVYFTS